METTLREIADLLADFGWADASPGIRRLADEVAAAANLKERSDVARRVLHLYQGGMGGFGDIVLQPGGIVDNAAQARLDALRSRLFDEALAAV